jgi:hypothetical protein
MKEMKANEDLILKNEEWKKYCLKAGGASSVCEGHGTIFENKGWMGLYAWLVRDEDIETMTDE